MIGIIIWIILILLVVVMLWMIINDKMPKNEGNFAARSVFSDFQNLEKRNAMETVIEEKAGKKRFEQESGDKEKHNDTTRE